MTNTISRVNTFFTKLPFPSSITAVITNTCTSVAAFTSCIALFFTVYSKVVFITFFWKREKKTLQSIKTTFYHKKTLIIWEKFSPFVHSKPWYPLSQPFKHVPFIWWHCSDLKQLPQGTLQLSPYIPPSQSDKNQTKYIEMFWSLKVPSYDDMLILFSTIEVINHHNDFSGNSFLEHLFWNKICIVCYKFLIELYLQYNLVLGTQVHTVDHRLQWYGDMLCCLDNVHNCCYTCLHKIQPYILLKRILSWVIHTFVKNCQCIFSSIHVWNKC